MIADIETVNNHVNLSINATQAHIQACMQAVNQRDKEAYKTHVKTLKNTFLQR